MLLIPNTKLSAGVSNNQIQLESSRWQRRWMRSCRIRGKVFRMVVADLSFPVVRPNMTSSPTCDFFFLSLFFFFFNSYASLTSHAFYRSWISRLWFSKKKEIEQQNESSLISVDRFNTTSCRFRVDRTLRKENVNAVKRKPNARNGVMFKKQKKNAANARASAKEYVREQKLIAIPFVFNLLYV